MKHIMLDCYGANERQLDDVKLINELLNKLVYKLQIKPIEPPHLLPYYYGSVKEDIGVSNNQLEIIPEDKFEEVYNVLQEEYVSKEEIEGIDKTHRIILKGESEEVFYIQNNGTIIKHEKDRYYRYTFENAREYDFRLKPDSPAIALGFKPLSGFLASGKE